MVNERDVAGLRCGEILLELSDYLDGELSPQRSALIEAHLSGCAQFDRFGKEFASTVASLRGALLVSNAKAGMVFRNLQMRLGYRD